MKTVYLVRHCLAAGQHRDSPLTMEGIRQAQLLSIFFSDHKYPIDKIISSPYSRAIESIKPYSEQSGLDIEIDDRLRERILSNEPIEDSFEALEHSFNDLNFKLPGGESANDAIERGNKLLQSLCKDSEFSNIILVTHGDLLTLLINQFDNSFGYDSWKELRHPDIYAINYESGVQSIDHLWKN